MVDPADRPGRAAGAPPGSTSSATARGVLSSRLRKLVDASIPSRQQYPEHPPRYEHTLTERGRALAPVITTLVTWGDT
jgi:DNA-binding HxlR family transcriptional regulator